MKNWLQMDWRNAPDPSTPVSAENLEDLQARAAQFTEGLPSTSTTADINQAIADVAALGGGTVRLAGGTFTMDAEIALSDNVRLVGAGKTATSLHWTADLGAGKYAIKPQAVLTGQPFAPYISDMMLQGPGAYSLGVQTSNMEGVKTCSGMNLTDMDIRGFKSGVMILADHNVFTRVRVSQNYYGVHFGPTPTTLGNQWFYGCVMSGNNYATFAIAPDNVMDGCVLSGCHGGFVPYGFYKYGSSATQGIMHNTILNNFAFEATGNAAFWDVSTGGTAASMDTSTILMPGFSWSATYKIAANAKDYAMDVRSTKGLRIDGGSFPFTSGAISIFRIRDFQQGMDVHLHGSLTTERYFSSDSWEGAYVYAECGQVKTINQTASGTVNAGDIVENSAVTTVRRYAASGGLSPTGVAVNSTSGGTEILVALPGSRATITSETVSGSNIPVVVNGGSVTYRGGPAPSSPPQGIRIGRARAAGGASGGGNLDITVTDPTPWPPAAS